MKNIKKQLYEPNSQWVVTLAILCLALGMLSGCAKVGPRSISMGRANYNEAINKTEDEQMLLSIVKGRYGETSSLLAVSGVAANINFSAKAGVQAGFGPDDNYTGNLVPFSGGLAYEENPTITYTPVHGEKYLRQLLSPVPLDILILFMRNEIYSAKPLTQIANRINDMRNPDFLSAGDTAYDPRFQRFVELNKELNQAGVLQLVENPSKEAPFAVLITGYAPAHSEKVNEYLTLIGLPMLTDTSKDIVIPVYFGVKGSKLDGIAISTRSTYDLIQILKAAVEIPQDHVDTGLAIVFPPMGPAGDKIRIHASKDEPKQAAVAVKNRGYWFYIDETDMHTKLYYLMVRTLWSVRIADAVKHRAAPMLTIPVSR
jgi:hypothetical protein